MLHYVGLTAGEAFVVAFLAAFIITAHVWPRMGASVAVWVYSRLHSRAGAARQVGSSDK